MNLDKDAKSAMEFAPPPIRALRPGEPGYMVMCHSSTGCEPLPTALLPREVAKYIYDYMTHHAKPGCYFTCEEQQMRVS